MAGVETIEGTVTNIIYPKNGLPSKNAFKVAVLRTPENKEVKIVGQMVTCEAGIPLRVTGKFEEGKHGPQFKVEEAIFNDQARDRDGIVGYLQNLPNVGPVRACTIYREFGEKVFEVIEKDPLRLADAPGITARMVDDIHEAFMKDKADRENIVFLKRYGITDGRISKILAEFKNETKRIITENPFAMLVIDGFGFKTVDQIASDVGIAPQNPERIKAGINYVFQEAEIDGHSFLPYSTLMEQVVDLLSVKSNSILEVMKQMVQAGELVKANTRFLASPRLWECEQTISQRLDDLLKSTETIQGEENALSQTIP